MKVPPQKITFSLLDDLFKIFDCLLEIMALIINKKGRVIFFFMYIYER